MRKFSHVFSFYFRESFLSKKSLITSGILFLVVFGIFAFNHFTADKDGTEDKDKLAVIVDGTTYKVEEEALNEILPSATVKVAEHEKLEKLRKQVEKGDLDGLFHVTEKNGVPEVTYMYNGFPSQVTSTIVANYFKQQYTAVTIAENNVSPEVAAQLQADVVVKEEAIKDRTSSFGIAYVFTFLLYMFIVAFGNTIAMNIATEKSSRVMELMLPKVKPLHMMYAKILAVVTTALLQIAILGLGFFIPYLLGWVDVDNASLFGIPIDLAKIDAMMISMFILYFITGYLLYAMMYAAAGAVVSKVEDIQSVAFPATILIMAGFFISIKSLGDPSSTIVVISSYVPFFSPMVTFSRIVAGEAGTLEISVTLGILIATIVVLNWLVSRIYVNGVMNYSDKVKFKDLAKFIRK
ncbi:sodium export permease [Bacillus manliponensis]|uniref:Sodium export permease n=1 Tax=Bacillus manliponensis TaxID=574376 RepID=A0A073JU23_9BACI|nr:ABC transporter permease [Bacillus manliponensis]KEK17805.1 sodium export permease [Bacillus manliponensis]